MKKILLVEGRFPIDGISGSLFRRRECVLQVASSGAEALAAAESERPDLVIFDAQLSDLTPIDFVHALHSGAPAVPVMIVAGPEQELHEKPILKAGAAAVIQQPLDEIAVNSLMCNLLGISMRRHVRTFVKMKVDATVGAQLQFATISNISLGGVLVDSEKAMTIGDIVKLSFFLPGDDVPITVISKVVRTEGQAPSYGCQFLDLSEPARARIHEFVTAAEAE